MAPARTATRRPSQKTARKQALALRTEASPLGQVQPETDAEFTESGAIPKGTETTTSYVKRIRGAAAAPDSGRGRRRR